jgi:hypothetical protein
VKQVFKMFVASAVVLSASASFAGTLSCQGKSTDGSDILFVQTMRTDSSVGVSIVNTLNGKSLYTNSWESDDTNVAQSDVEIKSSVSAGSRSEYFARLDLQKINDTQYSGLLTYDENDSGWEFSATVEKILCTLK